MSADNPIVLLSTDFGTIAISLDEIIVGRDTANGLIGTQNVRSSIEPPLQPLVSAERVAELFGVDATWFLTRARENHIPHVRLGKYVRFDPDEIRNFFHAEANRHANS